MASSYLPLLDVEEKATRCYLTPYTLSMPSPPLSHRMRTMPSSIVFVMLLGRLAHPHSVSGTMEQLYGYDRTQITKCTNHMLEYLFNEWAFLLELNETRLAEKMNEYCYLMGTLVTPAAPGECNAYLAIDGVNM
jgi:hypothetical protein